MEQQPQAETPGFKTQFLKLSAYFVVIILGTMLSRFLLAQLHGLPELAGFAKINEVITESLDITRRRDDTIVTLWALTLTIILVAPICWVYKVTKARDMFDGAVVHVLIVMSLIVCGMMMLIQDNFSRALALVGVVSAVRFRTNLKDPRDAVYLLVAIALGMGSGLGVYHVAALLSLVMSLVYLLLWRFKIGETHSSEGGFVEGKVKKKKKNKDKQGPHKSDVLDEAGAPTDIESPLIVHLNQLAKSIKDPSKGIKRPNAALLVRFLDRETVEPVVRAALESETPPWHVANIVSGSGDTTFECLGRINGGSAPPSALIEQIQKQCGPSVVAVEFKVLKKSAD
ncbi:MAG TPA: DUF4956 domain-containing protein [Blastocatellia bacterium]|nr:DUF4956 domain-containing protein [Blastocatellia bacterium]